MQAKLKEDAFIIEELEAQVVAVKEAHQEAESSQDDEESASGTQETEVRSLILSQAAVCVRQGLVCPWSDSAPSVSPPTCSFPPAITLAFHAFPPVVLPSVGLPSVGLLKPCCTCKHTWRS